jgi:uncharacterized protein (DUF488 family)
MMWDQNPHSMELCGELIYFQFLLDRLDKERVFIMKKVDSEASLVVLTIGHSTRTLEDFICLLRQYDVQKVVDVRTIPRSRHNPQFNREELPNSLKALGISYVHMSKLGGLRHSVPDSANTGWRNLSFRGFADYMQKREFKNSLQALIELAKTERLVLMCAEAMPWRCHRSLVADALSIRGIQVQHILSSTSLQPHKITPWAKVNGLQITYPIEEARERAHI